MNVKYFNLIVQLLAFEKLSTIGLKHKLIEPFFNDHDLTLSDGLHYGFFLRSFFGHVTEEFIEKALEIGVIEKTDKLYYIDPEDFDEEVKEIFRETESGRTRYFSDGYEVHLDDDDIIYNYKVSSEILEKAKLIYSSIEKQLLDKKDIFTFVKGNVKYTVPIIAVKLIIILNESKNISKDLADINKIIASQKIKDTINVVDSIFPFLHASTSWEKLGDIDWKDTVVIH